jgi:UDP-N-acetylmuramoyl-tripeptide--D-alanyl-D-alanine ligase
MKEFVQALLLKLSQRIIAKYKPTIIGITGSVGKTSTREAVFHVVSQKYRAYRPNKNFNNEIGLPLAIIGTESPGKSVLGWLGVLWKGAGLAFFTQRYPEMLVLEYGVDKPGDMDYLLSIAKPTISIITNIGVSHYEFFKSTEAIAREKGRLAEVLNPNETLIVNADNVVAAAQAGKAKAKVITYGHLHDAAVRVTQSEEQVNGMALTDLTIQTPTRSITAKLPAVGGPHIEAINAAVAAAEVLGIETDLVIKGIAEYKPFPGRLNIIAGLKHTTIIDDTYNAAPDSMKEALLLFSRIPANYKIAVLGDMRELGELSAKAHKDIGSLVATLNVHRLYTVGEGGKLIAIAAMEAGFPESKVSSWDNSDVAKTVILQAIEPDSLILIKGSQYVRMEKITKELLAEPMRAHELLCRQSNSWLES